MIVTTDKSERIKLNETPRWSEFHRRYYAAGYRWIKTRQKWSGSCLIHNFQSFTKEKGAAA